MNMVDMAELLNKTGRPALPARPPRAFVLGLLLALAALVCLFPPSHHGDSAEYTLTTAAIAAHGTPDIRYSDIAATRPLAPERARAYDALERDMRGQRNVAPAFAYGRDNRVYAIHFFGYSALAVVPYQLLQLAGLPPFKCFQVVNAAAILVLGLCLYRLFGSSAKAGFGLALFMLCGGALYWDWSSPECLSAAALLAGLILFCTGAPLRGGVLAGLAAQQNPTILFFFAFAPLLQLWLQQREPLSRRAALARVLAPRQVLALVPGLTLFALPPIFNLWQFGVPNIIVKNFTVPALASLTRLHSFFFDLNQGMVICVPAVLAALVLWSWRGERRYMPGVLVVCVGFTLTLAAPTLTMVNWNSDAAGVMRYAFWSAMPLLFALLWRLHQLERWPAALCAALLAAQAGAMVHAGSYTYVTFSPLARWVMQHGSRWYNPEPEIFSERVQRSEAPLQPGQAYVYQANGVAWKTMYHDDDPQQGAAPCGAAHPPGGQVPHARRAATSQGWNYQNQPVRCAAPVRLAPDQLFASPAIALGTGWSVIERGTDQPTGTWSDGPASALHIAYARPGMYSQLVIGGYYFKGNSRTRVIINGDDMGWHNLASGAAVAIPRAGENNDLRVELEHEAPRSPGPDDGRTLAFFLTHARLQ